MLKDIEEQEFDESVRVIKDSFRTVSEELGITAENAPRYTLYSITAEELAKKKDAGCRMRVYVNENGCIQGFYMLTELPMDDNQTGVISRSCEMNHLSVLPEARHQGLGGKLLEDAFQLAQSLHYSQMYIGIVEENTLLKNWYGDYGFVPIGTRKYDFFPFTCGYMVRKLYDSPHFAHDFIDSLLEEVKLPSKRSGNPDVAENTGIIECAEIAGSNETAENTETKDLERAVAFAENAHHGTYRKGTHIPYLSHPLEAMTIVAHVLKHDNDEKLLLKMNTLMVAAVLHDVAEDTDYSISDIENAFGSEVAKLVGSETENKRPDLPAADTWHIRKQETLLHLENQPLEVKLLTMADKLSNIRSMAHDYQILGDQLWNRFHQKDKKEHAWYYRSVLSLIQEFSHTEEWKEYEKLCDFIFGGNTN